MATVKSFYKVDNKNRVIVIDRSVKSSDDDWNMIDRYMAQGFTMREKILRKTSKRKQITDAEILKALEGDETALAHYKDIKDKSSEKAKDISYKGKKGFMPARAWYENEHLNAKEEPKK